MSLIKLTHDSYLPVSPGITKDEYDEWEAYELLLLNKPIYNMYCNNYKYPWLLHLRQSLHHIHLEGLKRVKVFNQ